MASPQAPLIPLSASSEYRWVAEQLQRFSYRPGCTFETLPEQSTYTVGLISVAVRMEVIDARQPTEPDLTRRVPPPVEPLLIRDDGLRLDEMPSWVHPTRDRIIEIGGKFSVPEYVIGNEDEFAGWLAHVLIGLETHESREWLHRDGKIWDDPHKRRG